MRTVVGTLAPRSLQISSTSGWGRISTVIGPTLYVSPPRRACPVLRYPPWVAQPDSASARTKAAARRLRPRCRGRSSWVLGGAATVLSIATLDRANRVPPPHPARLRASLDPLRPHFIYLRDRPARGPGCVEPGSWGVAIGSEPGFVRGHHSAPSTS